MDIKIQKVQKNPMRINTKRPTLRHIKIKLWKTKPETMLKVAREK